MIGNLKIKPVFIQQLTMFYMTPIKMSHALRDVLISYTEVFQRSDDPNGPSDCKVAYFDAS